MSAYVAIISFSAVGEDGGTVAVPVGARVEYGDHFYNSYPEAFVPEEERQGFFGRVNPANGLVEAPNVKVTTPVDPPQVTVTEPVQPAPAPEPAPAAKDTPKSSIGRRTLGK